MFGAEFIAEQFATSYMKIISKITITVTNMKRKFIDEQCIFKN